MASGVNRRTALRIMAALAAVVLMQGCDGSCSRRDNDAGGAPTPAEQRQDAEAILSHPVVFDSQSVEEILRMVESGRQLTNAEIAQSIVVAESSVNHLTQTLEELRRNGDDADTWNVLTEIKRQGWPARTLRIADALEKQQLDAAEYDRVARLQRSIEFARAFVDEICRLNSRFPDVFDDGLSNRL